MNATAQDAEIGACTALVLAGRSDPTDPVAAAGGCSHKALVEIGGTPMLVYVVRALLRSRPVQRIVISIDDPALVRRVPELQARLDAGIVHLAAAAATPSLSVCSVLDRFSDALPLLVTTADNPLLTPATVEYFWASLSPRCHAAAAVVEIGTVQRTYPESVRTYLRFRDATVTGCNLFGLLADGSSRAAAFWGQVERHRKHPIRMIRLLGPRAVLRYALRRMTMGEAIAGLSGKTGVKVAVVSMPFAEAGIDVDKLSDLALAKKSSRSVLTRC